MKLSFLQLFFEGRQNPPIWKVLPAVRKIFLRPSPKWQCSVYDALRREMSWQFIGRARHSYESTSLKRGKYVNFYKFTDFCEKYPLL